MPEEVVLEEVVLTTRRARLGRGERGRLVLTDRRFEVRTDRRVVVVPLADVLSARRVLRPRPLLEVRTVDRMLRLRCFAPAAVAALLEVARVRGSGTDAFTDQERPAPVPDPRT